MVIYIKPLCGLLNRVGIFITLFLKIKIFIRISKQELAFPAFYTIQRFRVRYISLIPNHVCGVFACYAERLKCYGYYC